MSPVRTVPSRLAGLSTCIVVLAGVPSTAQSTPSRRFAWSESLAVEKGQELRVPAAVAAAAGEVAVADAARPPRLLRFRQLGASWQLDHVAPLPAAPLDLVFDGDRWIASLREGVGLMAFEGAELSATPLPGPRELLPGRLAATPEGRLLVHDLAGRRVVELDGGGQIVRQVEIAGHVTALAADWRNGLLVALASESRVIRFDGSWNEVSSWSLPQDDGKPAWPVSLSVDPGGEVLVLDRHGGRILVLDPAGRWLGVGSRRGWEPGLLFLPSDLVRLHDGRVVVADQGNGRVQIFRPVSGGRLE